MLEDFIAIVPYQEMPQLDAGALQHALEGLEAGASVVVEPGVGGALNVRIDHTKVTLTPFSGSMPEEAALASIGMGEVTEEDAQRLMSHGGYVMVEAHKDGAQPMDRMVALLKCGMALCTTSSGWALCVPSSGLCIQCPDLQQIAALDKAGPRVWGLDEAEAALSAYEPRGLWESLRKDAQPAKLLVGFVPAQVENTTWFFSAGHSSFGLPEFVYSDGTLDDFTTIRELFRFLFPYFYLNPEKLQARGVVKTADGSLTISLHELPQRFEHLQASTGTLRVRLQGRSQVDSEWE